MLCLALCDALHAGPSTARVVVFPSSMWLISPLFVCTPKTAPPRQLLRMRMVLQTALTAVGKRLPTDPQ